MSSATKLPPSDHEREAAAKHVAEAHELLNRLRAKLDKHPELEEAILKLEMALNSLTVKTGGML